MPSNPDAPQDFTHVILGFPSEGWAGEGRRAATVVVVA